MRVQHLRDQQSELAVAQHGDAIAFRDLHLIENLAGGGHGFDEDGVLGRRSSAGTRCEIVNREASGIRETLPDV